MEMAELQPEEVQHLNGGAPPPVTTVVEAPTTAAAAAATVVGSKRQRRPSVRLGEIGGDQHHHVSYDSPVRSRPKWRPSANRKDPNQTGKSSRIRTLTKLSSGYENIETLDDEREGKADSMAIGGWRVKKRVGPSVAMTKRVRSSWALKTDEIQSNIDHGEAKFSGGEEMEDGFRDFNREDSESPTRERSPVNSPGHQNENRRRYNNSNNNSRIRFSESREFELSEPSDMDGGGNGGGDSTRRGREGVRIWLEGLGLRRYWPVFEIHEVDDEVLPLLTLEDLKDMGINAVGSRRKMYCAIQKLGKEFS